MSDTKIVGERSTVAALATGEGKCFVLHIDDAEQHHLLIRDTDESEWREIEVGSMDDVIGLLAMLKEYL